MLTSFGNVDLGNWMDLIEDMRCERGILLD